MRVEALTDKGPLRSRNEDRFLAEPDLGLFIVADGMGGHKAGEIASRIAVETVKNNCSACANQQQAGLLLQEALCRANEAVFKSAQENEAFQGMGTTITAALIVKNFLYIAHVGDSRAYLFRKGKLYQLTRDHSLAAEMLRAEGLRQDEVLDHPQRNVLTRSLGTCPSVEIDIVRQNLYKGDILLLCTDGLTGTVSGEELKEILSSTAVPKKAVRKLINLALKKGGTDNVTVVLVNYD